MGKPSSLRDLPDLLDYKYCRDWKWVGLATIVLHQTVSVFAHTMRYWQFSLPFFLNNALSLVRSHSLFIDNEVFVQAVSLSCSIISTNPHYGTLGVISKCTEPYSKQLCYNMSWVILLIKSLPSPLSIWLNRGWHINENKNPVSGKDRERNRFIW